MPRYTITSVAALAIVLLAADASPDPPRAVQAAFAGHTRAYRYHQVAAKAMIDCFERTWRVKACAEHLQRYIEALEWVERAKQGVVEAVGNSDVAYRSMAREYERYPDERREIAATEAAARALAKAKWATRSHRGRAGGAEAGEKEA